MLLRVPLHTLRISSPTFVLCPIYEGLSSREIQLWVDQRMFSLGFEEENLQNQSDPDAASAVQYQRWKVERANSGVRET